MIDIPTALTPVEADALESFASGKNVLEVGSLLGFSTITMAMVAKTVASVDPHDGYPAANPRPTWEPFLKNLARFDVLDNVTPYRDTLSKETRACLNEDHPPFDFAFIDVDGTYETTIQVMETVEKLMHADAPIIAVHDYGLLDWPGATVAVKDYCTQRGTNFGLVDTLALIRLAHPDD